jgi:hypothetical protein
MAASGPTEVLAVNNLLRLAPVRFAWLSAVDNRKPARRPVHRRNSINRRIRSLIGVDKHKSSCLRGPATRKQPATGMLYACLGLGNLAILFGTYPVQVNLGTQHNGQADKGSITGCNANAWLAEEEVQTPNGRIFVSESADDTMRDARKDLYRTARCV